MTTAINKVSMFPSDAIEVGYYYNMISVMFYAKMPGGERKLTVLNSQDDFREKYCKNCPRFCTKELLREETKKRNMITTTFNMTKVREELGLCTANEDDINTCPEGHEYINQTELKIETLPYIWLHEATAKPSLALSLFIYDNQDEHLLLEPYTIPNVYKSGAACWGKKNPNPTDIRSAEIFFWNSNFNDSITDCKGRSFSEVFSEMNEAQRSKDFSAPAKVFDTNSLFSFSGEYLPDGAFVTNNPKFLDKFPSELVSDNLLHGFIYELPDKLLIYRISNHLFLKEGSTKSITNVRYLGTASELTRITR